MGTMNYSYDYKTHRKGTYEDEEPEGTAFLCLSTTRETSVSSLTVCPLGITVLLGVG
jgi:hypothetical protein